jgi:hypothetical protein
MATNWKVPTATDLLQVLSAEIIRKADANISADNIADNPGAPIDTDNPVRSPYILQSVIDRVRAAIRNAGHTPLSVTANAVPPEAFLHVLYLTAYRLVSSTPSIQMFVLTEGGGVYAPFAQFPKQAEEWIKSIPRSGITPPIDPVGSDWTTAETACDGDNPPISGTVRYGSTNRPADLTTQPAPCVINPDADLGTL